MRRRFSLQHAATGLLFALVCAVSFFTYVYGFSQIRAPIFDEHYYIPDAQRYIHRIHFQKHNPPLGKLLIAAGEWMLHGTENNDALIALEPAGMFPPSFDYTGYRLLPVLLAWLTAPVLFLLFLLLVRSPLFAFLFTLPYILDNALIVHQRAAMLEGPLLFFSALALLLFTWIVRAGSQRSHSMTKKMVFLGIAIGLAASVKFTGLVLLPLPFIAVFFVAQDGRHRLPMLSISLVSMLLVMAGIWQIHFALGTKVDPRLLDRGYYLVSPAYHRILDTRAQNSPFAFPVMLRDALQYARYYSKQIPSLSDQTNVMGSPPYLWPLGGRSIRYAKTGEGQVLRTLALQINPIAWLGGIVGVLAYAGMIVATLRRNAWQTVLHEYVIELTLLGIYAGYLGAMSSMRRVMFLYHFFLPLLCSFLLLGLALHRLRKAKGDTLILICTLLWMTAVCIGFLRYAPLTYFLPLDAGALEQRALLPLWKLP